MTKIVLIIKLAKMDIIEDVVDFNIEQVEKLEAMKEDLEKIEDEEKKMGVKEMLKNRVIFEVKVDENLWSPKILFDKLKEFF